MVMTSQLFDTHIDVVASDGTDNVRFEYRSGGGSSTANPSEFVYSFGWGDGSGGSDQGMLDGVLYSATASASASSSTTIHQQAGSGQISGFSGTGNGNGSASWGPPGLTGGGGALGSAHSEFVASFEVTDQPVGYVITANVSGDLFASARFTLSSDTGIFHEVDIDDGGSVLDVMGTLQPGRYHIEAYAIGHAAVSNQQIVRFGSVSSGGTVNYNVLFDVPPAAHWINPAGGAYGEVDNWSIDNVPGSGDILVFDQDATYTVAVDGDRAARRVNIARGDVRFDLSAGSFGTSGPIAVGTQSGAQAILRVSDLDRFNPSAIIVGLDAGAQAALVLGPAGANPAGFGAGEFADGSGGTGAFLPTTTLLVGHRAQAVVQNATAELGSITVEPGPEPVPYPDLTDVPGRLAIKQSHIHVVEEISIVPLSNGDNPGVAMGLTSATVTSPKLKLDAFTVLTQSTLETLPGGTATVGEDGDAVVQVMDGSMFRATGAEVTVGENGSGTVEITGQSNMAADTLTLGKDAGSAGEVSVSSVTGTSTINAPQIIVAAAGSGMLRVADGGEVISDTLDISIVDDEPPPDDTGSGAILPDGAGQLIVAGTGRVIAEEVNIGPMGALLGDGLVEVDDGVTNGGKVKPGASPGTLTIIGPYTQTDTGELEIEFSGTGSGQYDVLAVQGDAMIDGTVALQFINGFAPQQGQQFEFLTTSGTADLSRASFEVQNLEPGFMFDITSSAGGIMMTALNDGVFVPDTLPGDYNTDGVVDAADYVVWRKTDGTPEGYDTWRANFGRAAGMGATAGWAPPEGWSSSAADSAAAVPEPAAVVSLIFALSVFLCARRDFRM